MRTGKVAGIGGWEFDVVNQRLALSDQVKHVHGLPPNAAPTLEDTIATYAPEAQGAIREAIDRALTRGWAWSVASSSSTASIATASAGSKTRSSATRALN